MKNLKKKMKKQGGFTLVEMLIVVAIIAILVAVSIPLVGASLDKAKEATDNANLRAAKAEAVLMYMNHELDSSLAAPTVGMKYDNVAGKFVDSETDVPAYGQTTKTSGKVVKIIAVKGSGTVPADDAVITVDWG